MLTSFTTILLSIPEWIHKIWEIILSIGDFFVLMWNDEDRWWCIAGFLLVLGFVLVILATIISQIVSFFKNGFIISSDSLSKDTSATNHKVRKVTIKGVYQMNGPKPFTRTIECSSSETGYYSQLMGNKSKQAQWIQANFPGANVSKGFSMTVNIK